MQATLADSDALAVCFRGAAWDITLELDDVADRSAPSRCASAPLLVVAIFGGAAGVFVTA